MEPYADGIQNMIVIEPLLRDLTLMEGQSCHGSVIGHLLRDLPLPLCWVDETERTKYHTRTGHSREINQIVGVYPMLLGVDPGQLGNHKIWSGGESALDILQHILETYVKISIVCRVPTSTKLTLDE
jgi:hypothetical protein